MNITWLTLEPSAFRICHEGKRSLRLKVCTKGLLIQNRLKTHCGCIAESIPCESKHLLIFDKTSLLDRVIQSYDLIQFDRSKFQKQNYKTINSLPLSLQCIRRVITLIHRSDKFWFYTVISIKLIKYLHIHCSFATIRAQPKRTFVEINVII